MSVVTADQDEFSSIGRRTLPGTPWTLCPGLLEWKRLLVECHFAADESISKLDLEPSSADR